MTRSNIIVDFVQNGTPLSQILLRLKTLVFELENDEIIRWLDCEINGYTDKDIVPSYRDIRGTVKCDIVHGFTIIQGIFLPIQYDNPHIQQIITNHFKESTSAIEKMIKKDEGEFMTVIPVAAYPYLQEYVNGYVQNAKVVYAPYHFSDIYASIKNKVLDILLLLEQKCGNLDSYDLNLTDTKKQEVIPLILNIIFHDNSITIGNKNKIVDSHLMTQRTM